ncbi:uncharacterized protein LOC118741972 [Rhagoletis pomonella]|uniref:uncharacterized protein LOC118741972 n=1 Tax=Rhagoletis pomonella TaxID=28610 RepID=UPI001786C01C|nr:uncharacterized protein LOC118741972 [Rhagoletis pomonella]
MDKFIIKEKRAKPAEEEEESSEIEESCTPETSANLRRKFRKEWLQQFSWLKKIDGEAFCVACEKRITNNLSHLTRHAKIKTHCANLEKKKNQLKLDEFVNEERATLAKQVRNAEFTIVVFCIMHNLPFRLVDYLPGLLYDCCTDSQIAKALKCHRTKATSLAEILGDKSKNKIVNVLQKSKFSLIVDETTDLSCRKALVLVVRYFDQLSRKVKDHFLQLIELDQSDSESIYRAIKLFFESHNIPLSNLMGLATDGASTMAGCLNGLKTKLKADVNLFYIKCTCHFLHLCSSYACKKLPHQIEELCRNVYKFFAYSPKRIKDFKEFQDFCEVKPHKILGISLTRWLALEAVISRIIEQWEALQLYFLSCCLEVNGIKSQHMD